MNFDIDQEVILIACPSCHFGVADTLGQFKSIKVINCPKCEAVIDLAQPKIKRIIKAADKALSEYVERRRRAGR